MESCSQIIADSLGQFEALVNRHLVNIHRIRAHQRWGHAFAELKYAQIEIASEAYAEFVSYSLYDGDGMLSRYEDTLLRYLLRRFYDLRCRIDEMCRVRRHSMAYQYRMQNDLRKSRSLFLNRIPMLLSKVRDSTCKLPLQAGDMIKALEARAEVRAS